MRYLLDTHAVIWLFEDSPQMPSEIKELVKCPENEIYIHSVSLWEMAIKLDLGKLKLQLTLEELISDIKKSDFEILQIESEYFKKLSSLPFIHKDPFDRLLIASALCEELTIITIDENIQKYDVPWVW
jgi:PIN domain nuclease of toxin-antitoxin system